jgi:hypothetical protein
VSTLQIICWAISCAIFPLPQAELPPYDPLVDTVICTSFGAVAAQLSGYRATKEDDGPGGEI